MASGIFIPGNSPVLARFVSFLCFLSYLLQITCIKTQNQTKSPSPQGFGWCLQGKLSFLLVYLPKFPVSICFGSMENFRFWPSLVIHLKKYFFVIFLSLLLSYFYWEASILALFLWGGWVGVRDPKSAQDILRILGHSAEGSVQWLRMWCSLGSSVLGIPGPIQHGWGPLGQHPVPVVSGAVVL